MVNFDRLERLIKDQGKKKSFLCELAGKRRGYIADAKAGNGTISDETLAIFARELGTTVAYLTGESDEVRPKEKPADPKIDGLSDYELRLLAWFRSLPPEKRRAILEIGDGPKEQGEGEKP